MDRRWPVLSQLILKVASRCNLNCLYCYVYNKRDTTWKSRPAIMSDEVFDAALSRARSYCDLSQQRALNLTFHGGEPCLVGVKRFERWCQRARAHLGHLDLQIAVQTNGALLDMDWCRVFRTNQVGVGVSLDGAKEDHDRYRVDHAGRGSFDRVARGLGELQRVGVRYGILCVIPLGSDPLHTHQAFVELGCRTVTYILPDYTHDTIGPVRAEHGSTPCADFLIPLFDRWCLEEHENMQILDLLNVARVVMGGASEIETLGNRPPGYIFVETDGAMEGLDNLRVCENGISQIGLNVLSAGFEKISDANSFHDHAIFDGLPLPDGCCECVERDTCAGGHLPHRYSRANRFNNRSCWCADLLKLFSHVRKRLDVTPRETRRRREQLLAIRSGDCELEVTDLSERLASGRAT